MTTKEALEKIGETLREVDDPERAIAEIGEILYAHLEGITLEEVRARVEGREDGPR